MVKAEKYVNTPVPIEKELRLLFDIEEELTLFDIGACEGLDSIRYAKLFPKAKIYAFEPLPSNIEKIDHYKKYFSTPNIEVIPKALSDKKGHVSFYVSSGTPEGKESEDWDYGNKSSSLLAPDATGKSVHSWLKFDSQIEVETMTLKEFCKNNDVESLDFIHMDVQGAELMVLAGAESYLSKVKMIWMEVEKVSLYKGQPLQDDVEQFMRKNEFVKILDTVDNISGDQLYVSKLLSNKIKLNKKKNMIKDIKAAVKNIFKPQTQKVADQRVNTINDLAKHVNSYADWKRAGAFLPLPHIIKQQVILEYKEKYKLENLIETGTFKGDMVDACKDYFSQIYSIELSEQLYTDAVKRFSDFNYISIIQGDSMDMLKTVLPKVTESPLFWLDGHYSAGITAKGKLSTPVKTELEDILNFAKKAKWQSFVILVDDARCFTGEDDYPTLFELNEFVKGLDQNLAINVKDDIIRICK